MSLDGFLTFLALAAAIYAVTPAVVRLRARLGLAIQIPFALGALLLVLYFEFFELFGQPCPIAFDSMCKWLVFPEDESFTPAQAAFVVVLSWMALAWAIHKFSRPNASSLPAVSRLVDVLAYEKRYAELLELVAPYLPVMAKAARRRLYLQRLHDWVAGFKRQNLDGVTESLTIKLAQIHTNSTSTESPEIQGLRYKLKSKRKSWPTDKLKRWFGHLSIIIPKQQTIEVASQNIARVLFLSADIQQFIAKMRPYFATKLLRMDLHDKHEFSNAFFTALISDRGSVLYQEFRQNQNYGRKGYWIPKSNRLLYFLFADAKVAEQLGVWKPVGEFVLANLSKETSKEYVESLNRKPENFDEEMWQDWTFMGLFFFDLMVTSAAHQGVKWHMWLYYFPLIVEKLEENFDISAIEDPNSSEFPTRSARLIYEALHKLSGWIRMYQDLPEDSPHRRILPTFNSDNGNIPISAAIALGRCMKTISTSARINEKFAAYMHEVVMTIIKDLPREGDEGRMRSFLIGSVVRGGSLLMSRDDQYVQRLITYFGMADHVLRANVDDYKEALEAA